MINVYIVSGFLGAGKTTFIKKLLAEKKFDKVMLLENEFGEVGVDGSFFDSSLKVKEINNGCICCSLQGDFSDALEDIEEMGVSDLIIEPSGVGKLSEIINVVKQDPDFRIVSHICIVDVKTCRKYHVNFKEYFDDQVKAANAVVLSHLDVADEETINKAIDIVRDVNDNCDITSKPIEEYDINDLLDFIVNGGEIYDEVFEECCCGHHHHDEDEECCCGHHHHDEDDECCCGHHHHEDDDEDECCCGHHHHDDDDECCYGHHHHDEDEEENHHHHEHHHHHHHDDETFKNMILRPTYKFSKEELEKTLSNVPEDIIRIKGYVLANDGTLYFNYILNEYNVFYGSNKDEALVSVIGTEINHDYFKEVFHG